MAIDTVHPSALHFIVGQVAFFAMDIPPIGWIECDGKSLSKTEYPALFTAIQYRYSTVTSGDLFNVPDLRGEFIRGWSRYRVDADLNRVLGSWQADEFKSHAHASPTTNGMSGGNREVAGGSQFGYDYGDGIGEIPTAVTGGSETRPRNVALMPCVFAGV